ncbi:MAG: SGNH/GDSL hydrolase family protein [Metamycoplasmataceae bacterium]
MSIKQIDISKEKIRYLAIGDSIGEGFNAAYGIGFPGEIYFDSKSNKNEIRGMSYPSILAKMLNDISPNCIEEFDNFCLTGTRISDWLYFLGVEPKKYNFKNSERQILDIKQSDRKENNPQKRRAFNQFGMFGINDKNDFNKLKNKIKNANLITITIGANDWITEFPFLEITSLKNGLISKKEFDRRMDNINNQIFEKLRIFFSEIRIINPTANIIVTSYPSTLPVLARLSDKELNKKGGHEISLKYYIEIFNKMIIEFANNANMYFVNVENKDYWEENIDNLSSVFCDIHPTYFGYKKIAHEIFYKIALSNDFHNKSFEEIKNIIPNMNKLFFESDKKKFSNVIDFSNTKLVDTSLIELSNITNEKTFWSNNFHEKEFLNLKERLSIKKFITSDARSSSYNNVNNFLNSFLIFIEENNFDPKKKMEKILKNKKYTTILLEIIYKSDYLDIVVNEIQKEIDKKNKLKIKSTTEEYDNLILNKIFDASSVFLLLKDFSMELKKSNDKDLLTLIEQAFTSVLINVYNSPKYNQSIREFIKIKAVNIISKRFNSTQLDQVEILVNNFLDINLEFLFINLMSSYFEGLSKIENLKNINSFIKDFVGNFFKKLDMKLIIENIIGNDPLEYFLSEVIINILGIRNYTVQDVLLFKKFINLLVSKINNIDLIVRLFSKFVTWSTKENKKTKASTIDFIWSSESNELWSLLNQHNIKKMWTNQNDVFVLADIINLVFEKSSIEESEFYNVLMNINHPKTKNNSLTSNLFNIAKDWIERIHKIESLYLVIANTLYNSFLEFKKINPSIRNEDNPYYKSYYRFVVSSLWICFRLFQKDISINIFWNTKKGILRALPTISSHIHKLSMGNSRKREQGHVVNYIFGEEYTKYLLDFDINEKNLEKSMLWTIQNSNLSYEPEKIKKQKRMKIINSLKRGYWENS